jgi:hypothetical protein
MRILASVPLTNDPALDPALFVSDLQDAKKNSFFSKFLCLFLFELTSFFKDKKSQRSPETVEIKVFLHFLRVYIRIRIRTNILRIQMRVQEAQKHMDNTDPDPEHW